MCCRRPSGVSQAAPCLRFHWVPMTRVPASVVAAHTGEQACRVYRQDGFIDKTIKRELSRILAWWTQMSNIQTRWKSPTRPHKARGNLRALVWPSAKLPCPAKCELFMLKTQAGSKYSLRRRLFVHRTRRNSHPTADRAIDFSHLLVKLVKRTHQLICNPLLFCTNRTTGATASTHFHRSSEALCVHCVKYQVFHCPARARKMYQQLKAGRGCKGNLLQRHGERGQRKNSRERETKSRGTEG